jgi:ribokinase
VNSRIWILGSSNVDHTFRVKSLPAKGSTISSGDTRVAMGGKGANQAIAAAHWGADVYFIGAVGDDDYGRRLLDSLVRRGVDTVNVSVIEGIASGQAIILVDDAGDNVIVIHGGANLQVPRMIPASVDIGNGDIFVAQLETNLDALEIYAAHARKQGALGILNPSPCRELPPALLENIDVIVANEIESSQLGRVSVDDARTAHDCGKAIRERFGTSAVITTLGPSGAVLVTKDGSFHFPGHHVAAVDTQGAGDAFLGSLAARLAEKAPMEEAVSFANWVAARSVTRQGSTRESLPDPASAVGLDVRRFTRL